MSRTWPSCDADSGSGCRDGTTCGPALGAVAPAGGGGCDGGGCGGCDTVAIADVSFSVGLSKCLSVGIEVICELCFECLELRRLS